MFGLNWVDLIIVALLVGAIIWGMRVGIVIQACTATGFIIGLVVAGWLFPHLLRPIHDRTLITLININLVLIVAFYTAIRGFDLGYKFHSSLARGKWHMAESGLGAIINIGVVLVLSWMLCSTIGRFPFEGLSNSANDAYLVQKMTDKLPPVPAILGEFNLIVDPNSSPYIFEKVTQKSTKPYSLIEFEQATAKAQASTVRITSFGCGSIVSGSGFVVGPNLVATNAHVVAGVKRPIIKYNQRSYESVPILFDANKDFAILQVKGLPVPALKLAGEDVDVNTTVAVIGFPNGNKSTTPGIVRNNLYLFGRNIYDLGVIQRNIYEVQTDVGQGSSGGPIVLPDGRVAGVIFAKSTIVDGYAYALTSQSLLKDIVQAKKSDRRISTGACLAD